MGSGSGNQDRPSKACCEIRRRRRRPIPVGEKAEGSSTAARQKSDLGTHGAKPIERGTDLLVGSGNDGLEIVLGQRYHPVPIERRTQVQRPNLARRIGGQSRVRIRGRHVDRR